MVRRLTVLTGLVVSGTFACVHIPDEIRREFRASEPGEVSNFRKGAHGHAPGRDLRGPAPNGAEVLAGPNGEPFAFDAGRDAPMAPVTASASTSASSEAIDAGMDGATL